MEESELYAWMPIAETQLMEQLPLEEELTHSFSRRFVREMKTLQKYERCTPRERHFYRNIKIGFAMLIILSMLAFGSVMTVEACRLKVIQFFVEMLEEFTSYKGLIQKPDDEGIYLKEPKRIPKGFEETKRIIDDVAGRIEYRDEAGNLIRYTQLRIVNVETLRNTEDAEGSELYIGTQKVTVTESQVKTLLQWEDGEYIYQISSTIKPIDLLEMTKSIIKQNNNTSSVTKPSFHSFNKV